MEGCVWRKSAIRKERYRKNYKDENIELKHMYIIGKMSQILSLKGR